MKQCHVSNANTQHRFFRLLIINMQTRAINVCSRVWEHNLRQAVLRTAILAPSTKMSVFLRALEARSRHSENTIATRSPSRRTELRRSSELHSVCSFHCHSKYNLVHTSNADARRCLHTDSNLNCINLQFLCVEACSLRACDCRFSFSKRSACMSILSRRCVCVQNNQVPMNSFRILRRMLQFA